MRPMGRLAPGGADQIRRHAPKRNLPTTGCDRRAISMRPGNRPPPRPCRFAACGVGGCGVNGDSWYRQAVGLHKSNGRWSLTDAHACILWIVQPRTARNLFGRPVATEFLIDPDDQIGAAHAAVMAQPPAKAVWLRPGHPAISRSSSLWIQII